METHFSKLVELKCFFPDARRSFEASLHIFNGTYSETQNPSVVFEAQMFVERLQIVSFRIFPVPEAMCSVPCLSFTVRRVKNIFHGTETVNMKSSENS